MNSILLAIILSLLLLNISCSENNKAQEIYSANENSCNTTCGFDHTKTQECYAQAPAGNYTKQVLLGVLAGASKLVKDEKAGTCVCVTAELEKGGSFTNIIVKKSNNYNASEKVKSYLQDIKFSPVPDEALCLLAEPTNPVSISLDNNP